jgi:pimeloyl-ACP methyl ester carboxylesterase
MRRVGGIDLAVYEAGEGRPVILVHGFPELGYSWRDQVPALADAGYRAIAFDMRGYGASDAPERLDAYGIEQLVGDLVGLADAMELKSPIVIGHDWGSVVVNAALVMHPERFAAGGSLNVPYRGHVASFPSIAHIAEHQAERFGYVLWFHDGSAADDAFAADPVSFLKRFYDAVSLKKDFLSDDDFGRYLEAFTASGITPALNYYRNIDANLAATAHLVNAPISVPYLMALADSDRILPVSLADGMERWVPDMRQVVIADSGHWTQQEQPAAVNEALVAFLEDIA